VIDVNKVAHLARLAITPGEEKKYQEQLTSIFKYFEEISALDTKGVEPLITPSEIALQFREDVVQHPTTVEEAMQNAPERSGNLFKVPPVV
jgi:aspartyl-tRNA(Asn)/glutamyl-tRNA(Gln) amidotransferase subunit C